METRKKPWGEEVTWAKTAHYAAKIIIVNPNEELSLQYHRVKDETILVFHGECTLTIGKEVRDCKEGFSITIPHGVVHRISAKDKTVILFEVSTPELDDVVRLEDKYGRADI